MRWPADHPILADPALAPWAAGADRLCPDAEIVRVLRHLPGRRVSSLVRRGGDLAVLKVYATSRARGAHRRLTALSATRARDVVPAPLGHRKGHVALFGFVPGDSFLEVADEILPDVAARAGAGLARLHDCGARLDRDWTAQEEVEQLRRAGGPLTRGGIEEVLGMGPAPGARELVPSHRDCHPAQVIVGRRSARFIDLDDCAMAPRALDIGNFVAHLVREAAIGTRDEEALAAASRAFLDGYGARPDDVAWWTRVSLARLAALEERRHRSPEGAAILLREAISS